MAKKLSTEDLVLNIIVNGNKAQSEIGKLARSLRDTKANLKGATDEMKQLEKQGKTNSSRYQTLRAEVEKYNAAIAEATRKLNEHNRSLKLEDQNEKQLEQTLKRLISLRKQSNPNSEDYQSYLAQIELVRNRLNELRQGAEGAGQGIMNAGNKLTRYIGALVAGGASLVSVWSGIKSVSEDYLKFDDILADVMKTTNLTTSGVERLNSELEKIQTRTNQDDLLGISRIAGKLGYTEISEITEFVQANNQIVVALNEDLGGNVEETINKIGKLVDIFKLKDLYTTEDAFLKVGSALNELGMASTANEGYMVEFARRMAGVAPLAGVTIEQILGLGATLDQLGQTEEVSSTALSKLFIKMASDAETYSKYAGLQVNDFKKLLEEDFMGAFVRVMKGVRTNANGINELAATLGDLGEDSGRVVGVLGTLANNAGILEKQIELSNKAFSDGTSITDEYNIKNQTAAARLEMAQKEALKYRRELGEKLWPILIEGNNIQTTFLKILSSTVGFLIDNYKTIGILTVAIAGWTIAANWNAIAQYAQAKATAVATAATRLWNAALLANPIGLVITGLATLTAALYLKSQRLSAATQYQEKYNDALKQGENAVEAERGALERNLAAATEKLRSDKERIAAVNQLRKLMPDHLKGYSDEAIMAGNATKAVKEYVQQLIKRSTLTAMQSKLDALAVEKRNRLDQKRRGWQGATISERWEATDWDLFFSNDFAKSYQNYLDNSLKDIDIQMKNFAQETLKLQTDLEKNLSVIPGSEDNGPKVTIVDKKAAKQAEKDAKQAERDRKAQERQDNQIEKDREYWNNLNAVENDGMDKQLADLDKKYNEYLRTTKDNLEERQKVAETYAALRLKREHEIDQESAKSELDRQKQLSDQKYQLAVADIDKDYLLKIQEVNQSTATEEEKNIKLKALEEENRIAKETSQQQDLMTRYVMLEAAIAVGNLEIEEARRVADEKAKIQQQLVNLSIQQAERERDKRLQIEKQLSEATYSLKIETAKAYEAGFEIVRGFFEESSAAAKIFLVLEKAAAAATVIINLQKELSAIRMYAATLGPFGKIYEAKNTITAKIKAGISLATIAATTIKGVTASSSKSNSKPTSPSTSTVNANPRTPGREDGGFFDVTREQDGKEFRARNNPRQRGYIGRPTVLVGESGREWVANDKLVSNPTTGAVIAWLDTVQRNGSINPDTLFNIIRSTMPGRASGGSFSSDNNTPTLPSYDPRLVEVLDRLDGRVNELGDKMQNMRAVVALLGKDGFIEQMKQLESDQDAGTL
ncbi:phage tail tape measure protein [Sphingobacterium thalpophilum]|uniref:phage tail tape measure protein n=1 Tax=Sphingobacterium thalpophilum TaxID=259 RepID=UPI0024A70B26|nr:phage tail tape measure protein [Sphingobacterium thalpophilum]